MSLRCGSMLLILLAATIAPAGTIVQVTGHMVDANGKPVVNARVGELWLSQQGGPLKAERSSLSGADGRFSLELELYGRDAAILAIDSKGELGAVATVRTKSPQQPLEMKLLPLVELRVGYTSEDASMPVPEPFITVFGLPEKLPVAAGRSRAASFSFRLPPGRYSLQGEGGGDAHVLDTREVTLEAGKPVDLGTIRLPLSTIARLYGKPAPAWHFADARGVPKEAQPPHFKGKWVVLEFWGHWCGPCTGRGLPGWVDFFDDHAVDRDKFEIVTVHERDATDFAMLDQKLKPIIARTWRGRPLPFPILLDTSGSMARDYGVNGYPTAVLLDPEGRVVNFGRKPAEFGSQVCEEFLASKLTPVPAAKRLERALNRSQSLYVDDEPLSELMEFYGRVGRIGIRLDLSELKGKGIDENVRVPLKVGGRLTLRSWLNLTLDPLGLTYVRDGSGLRIVRRVPNGARLSQTSARQQQENTLVAEALKKRCTFDFHGQSLKEVVALLDSKSDGTFVLDPAGRLSGEINPAAKVVGSVVDEPLSALLKQLLAPLGMTYVIRDECVVLTKAH